MAQPSKAAPVFLTLFALPFLGAGLFFLYGQLSGQGNVKPSNPIAGILFTSLFVLIGAGLIYASIAGMDD